MAELPADARPSKAAQTPMFTVISRASCAGTALEMVRLLHLRQPFTDHLQDLLRRARPDGGRRSRRWRALWGVASRFGSIGALIFGRVGDRVGRKGAFLITVTMMGGATCAIGLLPTYAQAEATRAMLPHLPTHRPGHGPGRPIRRGAIYVAEHRAAETGAAT